MDRFQKLACSRHLEAADMSGNECLERPTEKDRMSKGAGSVFALIRQLGDRFVSDAILLNRYAQSRDDAAFAALVDRHGPMVRGVCYRTLGDWHAAEDACQATFL